MKIITTGEGGMCLTNNEEIAEKIRLLINHGKNPTKHFWHDVIGFNYRMTNLQAAIGVAQLKNLDELIEKKREIAKSYSEGLKELEEEELITGHPEMPWAKCVYWMYCILVEDKFGMSRNDLMMKLEEKGIETRPFFYPMHVMPPYRTDERFLVAEEIARNGINLPSAVSLKEEEIKLICNEIKEIKKESR